jgi:hypothetical protein
VCSAVFAPFAISAVPSELCLYPSALPLSPPLLPRPVLCVRRRWRITPKPGLDGTCAYELRTRSYVIPRACFGLVSPHALSATARSLCGGWGVGSTYRVRSSDVRSTGWPSVGTLVAALGMYPPGSLRCGGLLLRHSGPMLSSYGSFGCFGLFRTLVVSWPVVSLARIASRIAFSQHSSAIA